MAKARDSIQWLAVVAIDFGTTYTGFAFSFRDRPKKIFMSKAWCQSHQSPHADVKVPTSVLVDGDGSFLAFGHEAETKYSEGLGGSEDEIVDEDGTPGASKPAIKLHLFRHFKMYLQHVKSLNDDVEVPSIGGGKKLSLFALIVMSLKYVKERFDYQLSQRNRRDEQATLKPDEIRWVITVPAIWSNVAKRFMRKAAVEAEIVDSMDSKQLLISLEPEAAALYCRTKDNEDGDCVIMPDNTRYMVVDAGGGTLDIAVHEALPEGRAREVYYPTGGKRGGNEVNACFHKLLEDVLGEDFIRYFTEECPMHWLSLMNTFESKKRVLNTGSHMRIDIPYHLAHGYREFTKGNTIETALKDLEQRGTLPGVGLKAGFITFSSALVERIFSTSVPHIVDHLRRLLAEEGELQKVSHVMLAGGFSESPYLQTTLREQVFTEDRYKLIVPHFASTAILQGAVLFGHNPRSITSRYARMTYGIMSSDKYDPAIHKDNTKIYEVAGIKRSSGIFKTIVKKGTEVFDHRARYKTISAVDPNDTSIVVRLYATDETDGIVYVDEEGVTEVDRFEVELGPRDPHAEKQRIKLRFYFGSTEIKIRAVGVTTDMKHVIQLGASSD